MKRVYYIANSFDGKYFVVTDSIDEYFQRMAAYALNLQNSKKTNTYTIGSLEMTEADYRELRRDTESFESSLIKHQKSEPDDLEENEPSEKKRPHLRLV